MTWIVDAQLPPRLCRWLQERGCTASHVQDLGGGVSLSDTEIWEHARSGQAIVLTKDRDFVDRVAVIGPPPQVIHIALGNCSNDSLIARLAEVWPILDQAIREEAPLIRLERDRVLIG